MVVNDESHIKLIYSSIKDYWIKIVDFFQKPFQCPRKLLENKIVLKEMANFDKIVLNKNQKLVS